MAAEKKLKFSHQDKSLPDSLEELCPDDKGVNLTMLDGSDQDLVSSHVIDLNDYELVKEIQNDGLRITLPQSLERGQKITRIRLLKNGNQVEENDAKQIKEVLREKQEDIQKIVIEQIRASGADRVSFLIEDSYEVPLLKITKEECDARSNKKENHPNIIQAEDTDRQQIEVRNLESILNSKFSPFNLRPRPVYEKIQESPKINFPVLESVEKSEQIGNYRQQVLNKKRSIKTSKYFYKAKNHVELFNIGKKYLSDVNAGINRFAVYAIDDKIEREKTILGLYAFFAYQMEREVIIFTESLAESFYYSYFTDLKKEKRFIQDEDIGFEIYVEENLQIYEFSELKRISSKFRRFSVEEFITGVIETAGKDAPIVFWDLPDLSKIKKCKEIYFPIIRQIQNISIVVKENLTKMKQLVYAIDYFKKYGIAIKGVLMSREEKDEVDKDELGEERGN